MASLSPDRIVLINLKRREDRLVDFCRQDVITKRVLVPTLFEAVDGFKVPMPRHWKSGEGAWGCMQSHRQVLERAIMDGVETLMVLEDDARFAADFDTKLGEFMSLVPSDWEGLWLGGQHLTEPRKCAGCVKCVNCQRTHAYVLRGPLLRDVYKELVSGAGHCDHIMGPMMASRKVYAPDPFIVAQAGGRSDISCREEHTRNWSAMGPVSTTLILAVGPREHAEAMLRQGAHIGYWRDEKTGLDRGLAAAMERGSVKGVRMWWEYVKNEAASIDGGVPMLWHPRAHEMEGMIGQALPGIRLVRATLAGGERLSEIVR